MESLISNIANLPLSWSVLFMLFIIAVGYYWYNVLPKIKMFDEQNNLIKNIIPLIGEDVTKIETELKNYKDVLVNISGICSKLESGMAVALREENEIKRLILTEMRQYAAPQQVVPQQAYSLRVREDPRYTPQESSPLDDMSIGQIKALLSQNTMEKVTEVNVDRLRNALSYLESEVPEKSKDSSMELNKLLSKY